ncbi:leucine Rich repeat-containing domain protein [Cooperia oncophora]
MQKNNISVLEALNFLNLPGNRITEINRQAFLNVPQLQYLYLTNNQISRLVPHQFASFNQIEMIDLTNNNITDIPDECIARLPQLRQLFLGGNRIRTIGKNAFANTSVAILSFVNNELTEIREGMLDGMVGLQSVAFRSNKIKSVHPNAFYSSPSLITIDLSDNEITELSPSTFLAQLNLQLIDLRNNKLTKTPYAALNHRVGTVFLQENPLVCTEKIHMLQDGVAVYDSNGIDLICGGRPTSTTTTSPIIVHKLPSSKSYSTSDVKPSGAFQQDGLLLQEKQQSREVEEPTANRVSEGAPSRTSGERQISPLPVKNIARSRGRFELGSQIHHIDQATEDSPDEPESTAIPPVLLEEQSTSIPKIRPASEVESSKSAKVKESAQAEPAENRNVIHPFPVPFLKPPQKNRQATYRESSTEASSTVKVIKAEHYTLPPTVVIVPESR